MDAVIFAKPPIAGQVKTRLAQEIGFEAAAAFAAAALEDTVDRLSKHRAVSTVVLSTPDSSDENIWAPHIGALPRHRQPSGDLGVRMVHAVEERLRSCSRVVLWGADAPHFPPSAPEAIAAGLETADVVICPAEDGGFYALGTKVALGDAFTGIAWSRSDTLEVTHLRLREAGLRVSLTTPCFDVDTHNDLRKLLQCLRNHPERAPRVLDWVAEWGLEAELGLGQPI